MPLNKREIVDLYRRRAKHYDFTAQLYYLAGFREWTYRKRAVDALALKSGDAVVELCCGTGLNFALLREAVGDKGRVIGVDMTDSMLSVARERVRRNGWSNVELVRSDAAAFVFPSEVNGILSTFALTLVPEYETIIRAGSESLAPGGRFVILDLKLPSNLLSRLTSLIILMTRPFGVTLDLGTRRPWESLKKFFPNVSVSELYGGIAYIATGEKGRFAANQIPANPSRAITHALSNETTSKYVN
jgi:ubiquinone/menaquinone biosynthesis C-methylase UbiE